MPWLTNPPFLHLRSTTQKTKDFETELDRRFSVGSAKRPTGSLTREKVMLVIRVTRAARTHLPARLRRTLDVAAPRARRRRRRRRTTHRPSRASRAPSQVCTARWAMRVAPGSAQPACGADVFSSYLGGYVDAERSNIKDLLEKALKEEVGGQAFR